MKVARRSSIIPALALPLPDDPPPGGGGGGGGPSPPPPPGPPAAPPAPRGLDALGSPGGERQEELDKWKPAKDGDFDLRTVDAQFRDKDPNKVMEKMAGALKGYRDRDAKRGQKVEAADKYTVNLKDELKQHFPDLANDVAFKALRETAFESGLTQQEFEPFAQKILEKLVATGSMRAPFNMEDEVKALGGEEEAVRRRDGAKAAVELIKANKLLGPETDELVGQLDGIWGDAKGIKLLEGFMKWRQETGPSAAGSPGGGPVTAADISARRKDERYRTDSAKYDPAFRKETDELARKVIRAPAA